MAELDPSIHDYLNSPIQGSTPVNPLEAETEQPQGVDSGLSSIEKSKDVVVPMIPLANFPILQIPSQDETFSIVVGAMSLSGPDKTHNVELFLMSQQLRMSEITIKMLDDWNKNLKEIDAETRRLVNSPLYQELQSIRLRGSEHQGQVSGLQSIVSANAAAANPASANTSPEAFISTINRFHAFERVPPVATIPDPADPTDKNATEKTTLSIPLVTLVSAFMAFTGGAFALGVGSASSTTVTTAAIVESLQSVVPQLTLPDLLPMINLLVMPQIYYTLWDNSVMHLRNQDDQAMKAVIQDFARHVLKMIADPTLILLTIVNPMEGSEQMSSERKEQMVAIVKLVLASLALSLLYSFDVGKVQNGRFYGMESQEFSALLSGQIAMPSTDDPKLTSQEKLMITLLESVKSQLDLLPANLKASVIETLFGFLARGREVKEMLNPSKTFHDFLSGVQFNPGIASFETNPT